MIGTIYLDDGEWVCDGDAALHGDGNRGEDPASVGDHRQTVQVGAQHGVHVALNVHIRGTRSSRCTLYTLGVHLALDVNIRGTRSSRCTH